MIIFKSSTAFNRPSFKVYDNELYGRERCFLGYIKHIGAHVWFDGINPTLLTLKDVEQIYTKMKELEKSDD